MEFYEHWRCRRRSLPRKDQIVMTHGQGQAKAKVTQEPHLTPDPTKLSQAELQAIRKKLVRLNCERFELPVKLAKQSADIFVSGLKRAAV